MRLLVINTFSVLQLAVENLSNDYSVFNRHCAHKRQSYTIHSHALMIWFWINRWKMEI